MMQRRLGARMLVVMAALVLSAATFLMVDGETETRTVTAHFSRAVSVYENTDVRILGVSVGKVLEVVPDGESVQVKMEYDATYRLPEDAEAVVVTPTLVADRFVQLTPAYTSGPTMADEGDIAMQETGVPVELDRVYAGLRDLSVALGPNGVNRNGTLSNLLKVGAKTLDGKGDLGNEAIRELSLAAETFGDGSGELFGTVRQLAEFTEVLATNDQLVRAFIRDLSALSSSLVSERAELEQVLAEVAKSVGTVKRFVADNRAALVTDVEQLSRVVKTISSERDSLDTALRTGPLAIGNLALAFNTTTGTIGSRIGTEGNIADADGFLCGVVAQADIGKQLTEVACSLFEQLLEPAVGQPAPRSAGRATAGPAFDARRHEAQYASDDDTTLSGLMGGQR